MPKEIWSSDEQYHHPSWGPTLEDIGIPTRIANILRSQLSIGLAATLDDYVENKGLFSNRAQMVRGIGLKKSLLVLEILERYRRQEQQSTKEDGR